MEKLQELIKQLEKEYVCNQDDYAHYVKDRGELNEYQGIKTLKDARMYMDDYTPDWDYENTAWEVWYLNWLYDTIQKLKKIA